MGRNYLKKVFWPNFFVGRSVQIIEIQENSSDSNLASASTLNQNLFFEIASNKIKGMLPMEPVIIPINDVLDLHTFQPREVSDLIYHYLSECFDAGIFSIRIIHGKGQGILKKRVHAILEKNVMVESFKDAPPEAGGWGATLVFLKRAEKM